MRVLRRFALAALVVSFAVGSVFGVPATASSPPTRICPVCTDYSSDDTWIDDGSPVPDESTVTVTAHRNGSATWVAELRWSDAEDAPDDEDRVEGAVNDALWDSAYLHDISDVAVDLGAETATVRWRTSGVVAERFDHHVLRPFHREGGGHRRALAADRLTIRGPEGTVVTNDPAAGTVADDGQSVTVRGPVPSSGDSHVVLEDFYVVFGDEQDAVGTVETELATGSLLWPIAGRNLFWLLVFPGAAFCVGLVGLYAAGRRWGADPDRTGRYGAYGLAAGLFAVVAATVGPVPFGSLFSLPGVLLALAALAAFGYAAAIEDRRLLATTGAAVPVVGLAPYVANAWPAVQIHGLYFLTSIAYTGLAVAVVVFGAPCYLFGLALGRRRSPTR